MSINNNFWREEKWEPKRIEPRSFCLPAKRLTARPHRFTNVLYWTQFYIGVNLSYAKRIRLRLREGHSAHVLDVWGLCAFARASLSVSLRAHARVCSLLPFIYTKFSVTQPSVSDFSSVQSFDRLGCLGEHDERFIRGLFFPSFLRKVIVSSSCVGRDVQFLT